MSKQHRLIAATTAATLLTLLPCATDAHDAPQTKRPSIVPALPAPSGAAPTSASNDSGGRLCATPAEAARIRARYATGPAPLPFQSAPELELSEAVIAAALPAEMSLGVDGTHFRAIWDSMTGWGEAMVLIQKGGNVFEIRSKLPAGEPSTRSKFFNLGEAAFGGHLRPDLFAAIHILSLKGREGAVRGVFFYDGSGASVFGSFIGGEGAEPTAQQVAAFEQTWALLQSLPRRCGG